MQNKHSLAQLAAPTKYFPQLNNGACNTNKWHKVEIKDYITVYHSGVYNSGCADN